MYPISTVTIYLSQILVLPLCAVLHMHKTQNIGPRTYTDPTYLSILKLPS